ncbi:hypothetical protein [Beijerinckia sp. L45]|uniref:hypothetical protein n=1 Tax=Beijerinckia sp. L45 TaxID=1641855 RepID=UPI00131EB69A|nr:hypothetical protein [Beijerinckia sp. L45]
MQIGAVTDIITHFVGLLHLDIDPDREWSKPDGSGRDGQNSQTSLEQLRSGQHHPDMATAGSSPSYVPATRQHDDLVPRLPKIAAHPLLVKPHLPHLHLQPPPDAAPDAPQAGAGGDGGYSVDAQSASSDWHGADQGVVDVHQVNMLIANASYVDHFDGGLLPMPYGTPVVHDMIDQAYAVIPADAPGLGQTDSQEVVTFKSFGDSLAVGSTSSADSLHFGTTVDGVLVSSDGSPAALTLPVTTVDTTLPTADGVPLGQTIVTGSNIAGNEALISDTSATPITTIVMGNEVHADLIVQSNVVQNIDSLATASSTFAQDLLTGGNTVQNTAHFEQLPLTFSTNVSGDLGTNWNVQVVNGDFYDVNAVTQQNVLINDTLYAGAPQTDHYYAVLGGNTQVNQFEVTHDAPTYDLLIVLGNSYTANAIYQENVLLNDATVGVTFSPTNGGADQVLAGHNTVTNDAAISDIGTSGANPMTPDLQHLVQSLATDGDSAAAFPGLPTLGTTINVMLVTGNYYDLNLVSQTNVISNSANVLADFSKAGAGVPASVTTGNNTLTNSAAIVSAGTLGSQYVGGGAYETSMLVQTNLVTAHADTSGTSPNSLVPELVAFLDTGTTHDAPSSPALPTTTDAAHHDILAGTLA